MFKKGDKIRCIWPPVSHANLLVLNKIYTVDYIMYDKFIHVQGLAGGWRCDRFEIVNDDPIEVLWRQWLCARDASIKSAIKMGYDAGVESVKIMEPGPKFKDGDRVKSKDTLMEGVIQGHPHNGLWNVSIKNTLRYSEDRLELVTE
jgi:hypothetical protein